MDFLSNPIIILISLLILIFSAILHEIAHGLVADKLGDPTARLMGRLTLNPIPHIDPVMSILVPLMLILSQSPVIFGGAKPVPVDPFNLKEGRKDLALVSLAGPLTNLLLAIIASLIFHLLYAIGANQLLLLIIERIVTINLLLAIFNLLPIPPLDGSKLFAIILPEKEAQIYLGIGSMGTFILLFLLFFPIGPFSLQTIMFHIYQVAFALLGF